MRGLKLLSLLLIPLLSAYFIYLIDLDAQLNRVFFYNFQSRDLARARELLNGHMIFYGPEMTGGGTLPGPFYYFILSAFLWLRPVWQSAFYGMMVLAGTAAAGVAYFLRSRSLTLAALLWVPLFAEAPLTTHLLSLFLNPSFNFALVMALLVCAMLCFASQNEKTRKSAFLGASLLSSLAIQVHFSSLSIYLAILFMHFRGARLRLPKLPPGVLRNGLILFAAPLVPHLVWSVLQRMGYEWGQAGAYSGQPESVWPTFVYLLGGLSSVSRSDVFRVFTVQSLKAIPWALPLLGLAIWWSGKDSGDAAETEAAERLLKPLWICAAAAFFPFSYVYLVPIGNRYGMQFYVALLLVTAIVQNAFLFSRRRILIYNVLAATTLAALWVWSIRTYPANLNSADWTRLAAMIFVTVIGFYILDRAAERKPAKALALALTLGLAHFQGFAFEKNEVPLFQGNLAHNRVWKKIWRKIGCATGWSFEEARTRLYFVNSHIGDDAEMGYNSLGPVARDPACGEKIPDGFFIAVNAPPDEDFKTWVLDRPIASDVKQGLLKGEIVLGKNQNGSPVVVPYFVNDTASVPRNFSDMGLSYAANPAADIFDQISVNEGARKIDDATYLFKWNECPDKHKYCDHGATVIIKNGPPGRVHLAVKVIGSSLSQVSPWVHPTWTQALDEPYVEIKCGGKTQVMKIANAIGYKRENLFYEPVTGYFLANNSLVAPFERQFDVGCDGKLEEISVGRKSSTVDRLRDWVTLPAKKLSIHF